MDHHHVDVAYECQFHCRFYLFLFTRLCGVCIALDMLRQIEAFPVQILFVAMAVGVSHQNWKTLGRMRDNAKASKEKEPPGSPSKKWLCESSPSCLTWACRFLAVKHHTVQCLPSSPDRWP